MLLERYRNRQLQQGTHREYLTGIIAAAIANWSLGAPEKRLQPKDFALALLQDPSEPPPRKRRINRRAVAAQIRGAFDAAMQAQKQRQQLRSAP